VSIFVIRHGETPGNSARIIQTPDTPLSGRGTAQAKRLARRLAGEQIGRILASDLARAVMTAECLQATCGVPIVHDPLLQERNFGAVRGTAYADLGFDLFAPDYLPPEGEGWPAFHERVTAAWRRIRETAAATPGHLAVVTHGLVCFSLVERHFALADGIDVPMRFGNTSLTVVENTPPWAVTRLNCTAHLEDDAWDDVTGAL
jgi:broad specificity phosphatase PhoE